jgi:hypothetical protein
MPQYRCAVGNAANGANGNAASITTGGGCVGGVVCAEALLDHIAHAAMVAMANARTNAFSATGHITLLELIPTPSHCNAMPLLFNWAIYLGCLSRMAGRMLLLFLQHCQQAHALQHAFATITV